MEAAADFSYHSNSFERLRNAALGRSRLALWRCAKEYEWNTACTVHHLQLPQELRSPQLRQGHVDQDYVALIVLEQSESGGTVRSVYDRVPKAAQYICGKPALPGVVVHDESGALLVARNAFDLPRAKVGGSRLCCPVARPRRFSEPRCAWLRFGL